MSDISHQSLVSPGENYEKMVLPILSPDPNTDDTRPSLRKWCVRLSDVSLTLSYEPMRQTSVFFWSPTNNIPKACIIFRQLCKINCSTNAEAIFSYAYSLQNTNFDPQADNKAARSPRKRSSTARVSSTLVATVAVGRLDFTHIFCCTFVGGGAGRAKKTWQGGYNWTPTGCFM